MKHVEGKPCEAFKIDKIKFDANSLLILDVFPPVFLSQIICITTSHSSGVMINTIFPTFTDFMISSKDLSASQRLKCSLDIFFLLGILQTNSVVAAVEIHLVQCFIFFFADLRMSLGLLEYSDLL